MDNGIKRKRRAMQFKELRMNVEKIGFEKINFNKENYFEGFFIVDKLPDLISVLETFFGPPAIPSSAGVSRQGQEIADEHGGVWAGQTFYFHPQENRAFFAMLWPWADKERITLKLGEK